MNKQGTIFPEDESFNPEMIKLARESRGLTQKELCDLMSIGQGTISKIENHLLPFTSEIADRAVEALQYPKSFFAQRTNSYPLSQTYYRRILSLSIKTLQQVEARLNIARTNIDRLLNSVDFPVSTLFSWDVDKFGEPELAAQALREQWRLPKGPVRDLFRLLEDNGVFVVSFDFGKDGIDGIAMRSANNVPIIFFNQNLQGDRRRLTVAHELGHLIMHFLQLIPAERDLEVEAFRFASEFLVPEIEFKRSFKKLDLPTLANMKRYWLVSMASLIYKAEKRNLITSNQARYLWQHMAKYGKKEPVDVPIEHPLLLSEIIEVYQVELGYSIKELAEALSLTEVEFVRDYIQVSEERSRFRVIKNSDVAQATTKHWTITKS